MKNFVTYYSLLISDVITLVLTSVLLIAGISFFATYGDGILAAAIFFVLTVPAVYSASVHLKDSITEVRKTKTV